MTTYTCFGRVRGSCGVNHKTIGAAFRCIDRDHSGGKKQGGYSDRSVRRTDGKNFTSHEQDLINMEEFGI